jgi:DNA-directed RNA polymerase specialized sigma24 family protein
MYKFDLQQYQSDRRYYTHVQPLSSMCSAEDFDLEDEGVSPLLEKFLDELSHSDMGIESHSRYWWVEEVSNPYLLAYLERLSDDDLEIITLFAFEHYSQVEIAKIIGISERSVHRKIAALRISAKK